MASSPQGDVPPHAEDPVQENPFPADDKRHEAWKKSTRQAELELHRLKQSTLERPRPQSPEQDQHLHVEFISRRFQIWAKRGLSVVSTYECARDYERWLDSYLQAELKLWEENCPAGFHKEFFLSELKKQLLRASEYWSGNALENVAANEAQGLTSPVDGNSARGKALKATTDSDSNWRNLSPDDPRYKTWQLILGALQRDESRARADFIAACDVNGLQLPAIVTLVEQKFDSLGRAIAMTVKNSVTAETGAQGLNQALELTLDLHMPWFLEIERRHGIPSRVLARESRIRLIARMEHWKAQAFQNGLEGEICALTEDPKVDDAPGKKATGTTPSTLESRFPKRAVWLENQLALRRWNVHDLQAQGGPDWKTARKILDGLSVSRSVLEKIAAALSMKNKRLLFHDIPQE